MFNQLERGGWGKQYSRGRRGIRYWRIIRQLDKVLSAVDSVSLLTERGNDDIKLSWCSRRNPCALCSYKHSEPKMILQVIYCNCGILIGGGNKLPIHTLFWIGCVGIFTTAVVAIGTAITAVGHLYFGTVMLRMILITTVVAFVSILIRLVTTTLNLSHICFRKWYCQHCLGFDFHLLSIFFTHFALQPNIDS